MPPTPTPTAAYSARQALGFLADADLVRFFKAAGIDLAAASAYAPAAVTLSADQDNWAPGGRAGYPVNVTAPAAVSGLAAGDPWETRWLWNVGDETLTLVHESSDSAAANRLSCAGEVDLEVAAGAAAQLLYDPNIARWRVVA